MVCDQRETPVTFAHPSLELREHQRLTADFSVSESILVYTALFGGHESLNPQPLAEGSG